MNGGREIHREGTGRHREGTERAQREIERAQRDTERHRETQRDRETQRGHRDGTERAQRETETHRDTQRDREGTERQRGHRETETDRAQRETETERAQRHTETHRETERHRERQRDRQRDTDTEKAQRDRHPERPRHPETPRDTQRHQEIDIQRNTFVKHVLLYLSLQITIPVLSQSDLDKAIEILDRSPHLTSLKIFLSAPNGTVVNKSINQKQSAKTSMLPPSNPKIGSLFGNRSIYVSFFGVSFLLIKGLVIPTHFQCSS